MDESVLEEQLAEELIGGVEILSTGNGFLVITDWRWPGDEKIEVHARRVAERDDLYLVTDGGELCNFLFAKVWTFAGTGGAWRCCSKRPPAPVPGSLTIRLSEGPAGRTSRGVSGRFWRPSRRAPSSSGGS